MHLPIDTDLSAVLCTLDVKTPYNLEDLRLQRQNADKLSANDILCDLKGISHEEHVIFGPRGPITLSVFWNEKRKMKMNLGVFFVHPGGMVLGNRFLDCGVALDWVRDLGAVCLTAEYRLAPEHPYPAALEDCFAALQWMVTNAKVLTIDAAMLMVVGMSGGGCLAAALSLYSLHNEGPVIGAQVLICPMLDPKNNNVSHHQGSPEGIWDRKSNQFGWNCVLGECNRAEISLYAAPGLATTSDLLGLPPTFIDVGESEIFRDECVSYASRLWAAGVSTELHVWPGGFHGFDRKIPEAPVSLAARAARTTWVCRWLKQRQTLLGKSQSDSRTSVSVVDITLT
jgi:acetyl esterase/lipase